MPRRPPSDDKPNDGSAGSRGNGRANGHASGESSRSSDRRRRGTSLLSGEDARLWAEVVKGLEPLKNRPLRGTSRKRADNERENDAKVWREAMARPADDEKPVAAKRTPRHGKASHDTLPAARRIPELAGFSRREMRQITTGRQSIEARLDLHGLRQAEAHMALRGFLVRCQDLGLRHVLVITGKGRPERPEEPHDGLVSGREPPGVLRRLVPLWLAEPALRILVAGFDEAPLRHGGGGALYVRLRRRR